MTRRVKDASNSTKVALPPPQIKLAEAKAMWRDYVTTYAISDHAGLTLLASACESLQDIRRFEKIVVEKGELLRSIHGSQVANPAVKMALEARKSMHSAIRQLGCGL
jgi:phage terminase small subunit